MKLFVSEIETLRILNMPRLKCLNLVNGTFGMLHLGNNLPNLSCISDTHHTYVHKVKFSGVLRSLMCIRLMSATAVELVNYEHNVQWDKMQTVELGAFHPSWPSSVCQKMTQLHVLYRLTTEVPWAWFTNLNTLSLWDVSLYEIHRFVQNATCQDCVTLLYIACKKGEIFDFDELSSFLNLRSIRIDSQNHSRFDSLCGLPKLEYVDLQYMTCSFQTDVTKHNVDNYDNVTV